MNPNRILHDDDLDAMVAGDSFDLLVERVTAMVTAGRRMVLAVREFTYTNDPPEVYGGLTLDTSSFHADGVWVQRNDSRVYCGVVLTDGTDRFQQPSFGFGEDIHQYSGNETEKRAMLRFDEGTDGGDRSSRRRDMTQVLIHGGLPGWRYRTTDKIIIKMWNGDGVCTEKVLGFEHCDGSW